MQELSLFNAGGWFGFACVSTMLVVLHLGPQNVDPLELDQLPSLLVQENKLHHEILLLRKQNEELRDQLRASASAEGRQRTPAVADLHRTEEIRQPKETLSAQTGLLAAQGSCGMPQQKHVLSICDIHFAVVTSSKFLDRISAVYHSWGRTLRIECPQFAPGRQLVFVGEHSMLSDSTTMAGLAARKIPPAVILAAPKCENDKYRGNLCKSFYAYQHGWAAMTEQQPETKWKWFVRVDDDTYYVLPHLVRQLAQYDPLKKVGAGFPLAVGGSGQFSGGPGILLSYGLMEHVSQNGFAQLHRLDQGGGPMWDDVALTALIGQWGAQKVDLKDYEGSPFHVTMTGAPSQATHQSMLPLLLTAYHHISPRDAILLDYGLRVAGHMFQTIPSLQCPTVTNSTTGYSQLLYRAPRPGIASKPPPSVTDVTKYGVVVETIGCVFDPRQGCPR